MFRITYTTKCEVFDKAVKVSITPTKEDAAFMKALAVYYNINNETFPRLQKCRPAEFIGIARLKSGDIRDTELAKKVAERKALRQMYSAYYNILNEMKDNFERKTKELDNALATLSDNRRKMTRQIKDLTI